ncbi:MAG: DUF3656 domain-containing protein [Clostridia bacterium]
MKLLSPAGNYESLVAAVQNGADAVYFGGSAFNARKLAQNFDETELLRAVEYCHLRGVKAYITFNTLVLDREMEDALKYGKYLYDIGADAVIVQDVGLLSVLHSELPQLALHGSTQLGIHDAAGAQVAKAMGLCCAVLSRETPLCAIAKIHQQTSITLEAFAHGALCMSFSGGCLFSSMVGERSGNRGTCAQPCRKRMGVCALPGEKDYALSLSDLCMVEHIADMRACGVDVIKLEGRMKRAEYVAAVTAAYRRAIDGEITDFAAEKERMAAIFDRNGRTGYFYGDDAVTGCVADAAADTKIIKLMQESYAGEKKKLTVDMQLTLRVGELAKLAVSCAGKTAEVLGATVQLAQKKQDLPRYLEQLKKLGGTVFEAGECIVDMPDNAFAPMSAINELRRIACSTLMDKMTKKDSEALETRLPKLAQQSKSQGFTLGAMVRDIVQARAAFDAGANEVAIAPYDYANAELEELQGYRKHGKLMLALPAVIIDNDEQEKVKGLLNSDLIDGAIAGNIGQIEYMRGIKHRIAGTQLNATNCYSLSALQKMGFERVLLSQELTKPQLRDILKLGGAGVRVYGRTELMQLMHCPLKEYRGCRDCKGNAGMLMDEAKREFPLVNIRQSGGCLVRMLNCVPTDITDVYPQIEADYIQLAFYLETAQQVEERITAAIAAHDGKMTEALPGATRGHWVRAVD